MTEPNDFIEERLKRLADATEEVRPTGDFDDWIMAAVQQESGVAWFEALWRPGLAAVVVSAVAAAASVIMAVHFQHEVDDAVMATFEMVELDE